MKDHLVQWTAPQPLWSSASATITQPAILRFATDSFMEDYLATVEQNPALLKDYMVQPETWRSPIGASESAKALLEPEPPLSALARTLKRLAANGTSGAGTTASTGKLKLYQPAHQRHYLLTSSLVCGITGLPDRKVDPGKQERVTFVIRRLFPPGDIDPDSPLPEVDASTWLEYAFVVTPSGSGWQAVSSTSATSNKVLVTGEEQLPMFGVYCTEDDGRKRKLFSGVIPVGKRESYMGAAPLSTSSSGTGSTDAAETPDSRMFALWTDVTEPWKRLLETADLTATMQAEEAAEDSDDEEAQLKTAREKNQVASWYVLLDFAKYLEQNIPNVWNKLAGQAVGSDYTTAQGVLVETLQGITIGDDLKELLLVTDIYAESDIQGSLADALIAIRQDDLESRLENVIVRYDREDPEGPIAERESADSAYAWPEFLFPLADTEETAPLPPAKDGVVENSDPLQAALDRIDNLSDLVQAALPEQTTTASTPPPLAAQKVLDTRDGWFVIRCVFERLNCGPLDPAVVSDATQPFKLAGFFDPDAPARPIRIALPIDTSTAGFRKFNKNTAFMVSDMLCGQIDRIKAMSLGDLVRSVLPWPFHKDLSVPDKGPCTDKKDLSLQAGMMCSFSIPIITICALILLIVMVSILDYIFRWLPYFFICFPLPGFKAKAKT